MTRKVLRPKLHGTSCRPGEALAALSVRGRVMRPLGGNTNMHWLIEWGGDRFVLRRYGPWRTLPEAQWEHAVLDRVANAGWRVPAAVRAPVELGRHVWTLFEFVEGQRSRPTTDAAVAADQRERGRLLGRLHRSLAACSDLGQRPGWVRRDEVLAANSIESLLRDPVRVHPDVASRLCRLAEQAQQAFIDLDSSSLPATVVHGDLGPTNVLHCRGMPVGIIDFDFTRSDLAVAELAWTWRRRHDEFLRGFEDEQPLTDRERALVRPAFWASALDAVRLEAMWQTDNRPQRFDTIVHILDQTDANPFPP